MSAVTVSVVYAMPERQHLVTLTLPAGSTARDAVKQSGLLERLPEIDPSQLMLGIYSRRISGSQVLEDGDRVEIYRPLQLDPKESRRQRARLARSLRPQSVPSPGKR